MVLRTCGDFWALLAWDDNLKSFTISLDYSALLFFSNLVFLPELVLCKLQVEEFVGKISKRGLLQGQHLMRLLVDDNSGMKPGEERHTSPRDRVR
jgi:hypothetical protein